VRRQVGCHRFDDALKVVDRRELDGDLAAAPAELDLYAGLELVRESSSEVVERGRPVPRRTMLPLTGAGVVSHYDIAIENGGAEFGFIQTDPNVVTANFERRRTTSQTRCSLATLKGNYVYAGDGFDVAGAESTQRTPFATAGREVYAGDGTLSGIDTTSSNGVVARSTYTSTYTVDADCSGTYAYSSDPSNPYELFIDPSGAEFAYVATSANRVAAGYERRR